MKKAVEYINNWFKDVCNIAWHELKAICTDPGVAVIFFVAGLFYPILYNLVYLNGIVEDMPIAVVDQASCEVSRRFSRELDATREVRVEYKCATLPEAEKLFQQRKVNGIVLFPREFSKKVALNETANISTYSDMSSFMYYKNLLMAVNHVMLDEMKTVQVQRYSKTGMTSEQAWELVQGVKYEENYPNNNSLAYNIFLLSAILFVILQQTMFYGVTMMAGTLRENYKSLVSLADDYGGTGFLRINFARGFAYWAVYMIIGVFVIFFVPKMFGIPQKGNYFELLFLLALFLVDCVLFSFAFSSIVKNRESVFILYLFLSPVCLFLTGTSWPACAFPRVWEMFSYLFPTTFGVRAFTNMSTGGTSLANSSPYIWGIIIQIIVYMGLTWGASAIEYYLIKRRESRRSAIEKDF